jgi:hypothetical protein
MRSLDNGALYAREYDAVLEMMCGRWECFVDAVEGEEALRALEFALRDEPESAPAGKA